VQPLLQRKSNKCYIVWVCVCSLRYPACNAHILSPMACPALQYFSTLSHRRHCFRKKKEVMEHEMCVDFSYNFVWNISHSIKNGTRCDQKCILAFMWSTVYPCQILMKLEFSRQIFEKASNIKFNGNPSCRSRIDGRTEGRAESRKDRPDEANSRFSQFCGCAYKQTHIFKLP